MPHSDNANLFAVLAARMNPDADACAIETHDARYYSWRDVDRASAKLANYLRELKLPAGARVAVHTEKSADALLFYLAVLRAGYVYMPLNSAYREAEVDFFVGDAEPSLLVVAPDSVSWAAPIVAKHRVAHLRSLGQHGDGSLLAEAAACSDQHTCARRDAADPAAIIYTSGTTGRSKGAVLSHRNLTSNALTLHRYWRWRASDVLLHALPIFHVHGLFVATHCAWLGGSKIILLPKFDVEQVLRLLPRCTVFMGVPTMYQRLLDSARFGAESVQSMRLFVSGSAPLATETFRQFELRTGQPILERYGMSETVMLTSNPYDGNRVAGTVGLPLPGVELRVQGDAAEQAGEIQVRGPNVFGGYWKLGRRDDFTADGWFKTGDLGSIDANGYVTIVGRAKDLIISGGYNVYPKEIENWIDQMPEVDESAVVGVADRDFGEAVAAAVVLKAGAQLTRDDLIARLKQRIAGFKVPRRILFVDALPRNQMGKVQKPLIRQQLAGG